MEIKSFQVSYNRARSQPAFLRINLIYRVGDFFQVKMQRRTENIKLPEGNFKAELDWFENEDKVTLKNIYDQWIKLSNNLKKINSRAINIPEGLSEGAFALAMGFGRFIKLIPQSSKANTSFDCYDLDNQKRIQVKASSIEKDTSSFGPRSVWDELYFVDFYKDGKWQGYYDIYLIPNHLIYGQKVNKSQTFTQQQSENRRPRFSIKNEIILTYNIKPIKTYKL